MEAGSVPDGGEQPISDVQEQEQQAPEPQQQESQAPWSSDLEERFQDPGVRSQVDQYVRESIQPYITQLEQESGPNRYAQKLWTDFTESPVDTYLAVTREMFGDEAAEDAQSMLDALQEGDENFDPEFAPEYSEEDLPPRVVQAVEGWEQQQMEDAYYDQLDRVAAENDDLNLIDNEQLFHPFVSAANGDFDLAVEGYRAFIGQAAEAAVEAYAQQIEENGPPPVIDSGSQQQSVPPVQREFDTLDDALDEFFEEERQAPPTV